MHVVLVEPEIPQNTGSIARTCAGTSTPLHLVGELGFSLDDRYLKRAGLDYWPSVDLRRHENIDDWLATIGDARVWAFTTHATRAYDTVRYEPGDLLVFGRESVGLPAQLRDRFADRALGIPLNGRIRSLNLSNAVAVVLFEALRQQGWPHQGA